MVPLSSAAIQLVIQVDDLNDIVPATLCAASAESLSALLALTGPDRSPAQPRFLLTAREDITAQDVVLSELMNQRGPAAWVAAAAGETGSAADERRGALLRLAATCIARGLVLVLTTEASFDLVLLPRQAAAVAGIAFAAFPTRVEGVAFIARTIAAKQVAVVLDLDSTLLESEHLPMTPAEWRGLPWKPVTLRQEPSGHAVAGRVCRLPDEPHHCETVHAASWVWKGWSHNYRVRQRLGWSHLRDLLIQEGQPGGKLSAYVLSLGRPLYIQTCWHILDPSGLIIAQHEFKKKVNSARPDGVYWVPEKTPCVGVGLRTVFEPDYNMRLGPVWIADDLPEVFMEKYHEIVFRVRAYKPVASQPNDFDADGSVLRSMSASIMQFWQHCYGTDGCGGAVAAASAAAQRALHQLCHVPLPSGPAQGVAVPAGWCEEHFKGQEAISCAMSVRHFLEQQQTTAPAPFNAVPAAPFVPENDENAPQPKELGLPGTTPSSAALPEGRVLRPSSRQENLLPGPPAQLHGKAGVQQKQQLAAPPAAPEGTEPAVASISIVPEDAAGGSGSLHHLVMLLACQAAAEAQGGQDSGAAGVEEGGSGGLDACPVELAAESAGTEVEDEEVMLAPAQGADEGGPLGRKRDFAAIVCQDSLLGPVAPIAATATV